MKAIYLIFTFVAFLGFSACSESEHDYSGKVSSCGGFVKKKAETTNCFETLEWNYENNTLAIKNNQVSLNCCGERSFYADIENNNTIVITEKDNSDNGARCGCMCTYDFHVNITEKIEFPVNVKIKRLVEGSDDYNWEGTFETSSGIINFEENTNWNCREK